VLCLSLFGWRVWLSIVLLDIQWVLSLLTVLPLHLYSLFYSRISLVDCLSCVCVLGSLVSYLFIDSWRYFATLFGLAHPRWYPPPRCCEQPQKAV